MHAVRQFVADHILRIMAVLSLCVLALLPAMYEIGKDHGSSDATNAQLVKSFNDGWIDADSNDTGDDNRDGKIERGEAGWSCRNTPLTLVAKCLTIAYHPVYGWTNPDGSTVSNPDGQAELADIDAAPNTAEYAAALNALTADWNAHQPH